MIRYECFEWLAPQLKDELVVTSLSGQRVEWGHLSKRDADLTLGSMGNALAVGIGIAIEALFSKTARLPLVDFRPPKDVVGTNTVASMQSGLYFGTVGMIDGILERILQQLGPETKMVATGGQARMVVSGSRYLKHVDEHLTLEGLQMIWERNHPQ